MPALLEALLLKVLAIYAGIHGIGSTAILGILIKPIVYILFNTPLDQLDQSQNSLKI